MEDKIIYKELSYRIVGTAFTVFNSIGFGMFEKFYQRAFEDELLRAGIKYQKEVLIKQKYNDKILTRYFLDFLIGRSIIVELKVRSRLGYMHIKQVMEYLKASGHKLAILIYFTREGVKYRRVVNSMIS